MFIVEKPKAFISGIFERRDECTAFFHAGPKAAKLVMRELKDIKHYPFFILEKPIGRDKPRGGSTRQFLFYQERKDVPGWSKVPGCIPHTVTKDWKSPLPTEDQMAYLEHEHVDG